MILYAAGAMKHLVLPRSAGYAGWESHIPGRRRKLCARTSAWNVGRPALEREGGNRPWERELVYRVCGWRGFASAGLFVVWLLPY